MALILLLGIEHRHVVFVLSLALPLRLLEHFDVLVDFIDLLLLQGDGGEALLLDLCKCLLVVLNQIDFEQVGLFEVEQVFNNLFGLSEWDFLVTVGVTNVEVDVRVFKLGTDCVVCIVCWSSCEGRLATVLVLGVLFLSGSGWLCLLALKSGVCD